MKKFVKYLIYIIIISILIIAVFNQNTSVGKPSDFETRVNGADSLADTFGKEVIGAIQAIGSILSVAILVILGIKYMMGSAEERAEYKKSMIPYLIGAILLFATPQIVGAIYTVLKS